MQGFQISAGSGYGRGGFCCICLAGIVNLQVITSGGDYRYAIGRRVNSTSWPLCQLCSKKAAANTELQSVSELSQLDFKIGADFPQRWKIGVCVLPTHMRTNLHLWLPFHAFWMPCWAGMPLWADQAGLSLLCGPMFLAGFTAPYAEQVHWD